MGAKHERSILAAAALTVAAVLCGPTSGQAQDTFYTTVTGRLDPRVEVRAQVEMKSLGDRWFSGRVGSMSVPVPPGNLVSCTMIALPELSPEPGGTFIVPLRGVRRLQVRRGEGDPWTSLDLEPLLEAEPQKCSDLGAEGVR